MNYYTSHDIKILANQLASDIKSLSGSLFQTTKIITQTKGMNTWLEQVLAKDLGILANYQFLGLRDFILEVGDILIQEKRYFSTHSNMAWVLFEILGEPHKELNEIKSYYQSNIFLQMELAMKLADLFDQYQVFRPDMIDAWNKKKCVDTKDEVEQWQSFLWYELKQRYSFCDLKTLEIEIVAALKLDENTDRLKQAIPAISLFGLSSFTEYQVGILSLLSPYIEINIYLCNYAPDIYWLEDESGESILRNRKNKNETIKGNSLLLNWGKLMASGLRLFAKIDEDGFFSNAVLLENENNEPKNATLLHWLQDSVRHNKVFASYNEKTYNETISTISKSLLHDKSINIVSNFCIKRELESLFNFLLDTFLSSHGAIKMKDVLVIVSDIDAYAPYIKGVFDQTIPYTDKDNKIKQFSFKGFYTIADERITNGQSVVAALVDLMNLDLESITIEDVLKLLENSHLRSTFYIHESQIDFIRHAADEASMRYGWENKEEDDTYLVGLKKGLERLVYGALIDDGALVYPEAYMPDMGMEAKVIAPVNSSDSYNEMKTIIDFSHFVTTLIQMLKDRAMARSLNEWKQYIEKVLEDFIQDNSSENHEMYWDIINQLTSIKHLENYLNLKEIPYEIFRKHFVDRLDNYTTSSNYLSKGITFCSPIPFRSLPFKVICALGMNYDNFPRKSRFLDFDLILRKPQFSDRNINSNDKQLFLDLIMNTEEKLYLSYIGKDISDKSEKPPSVLIDKLMDYISNALPKSKDTLADVKQELLVDQTLLCFNPNYNQGKKIGNNYLIHDAKLDKWSSKEIHDIKKEPLLQLNLKDIEMFCSNTIEYYYKKVLGVFLNDAQTSLSSTEVFDVNNLTKWSYRDEKLSSAINEREFYIDSLYLKGKLPLKNTKFGFINSLELDMQFFEEYIKQVKGLKVVPIDDLVVDDVAITGTLKYIDFQNTLQYFCVSSTAKNYKIKAYVDYLVAVDLGVADMVCFLTYKNSKIEIQKDTLTKEEAHTRLENIIHLMKIAQDQFICFTQSLMNKNIDNYDMLFHNVKSVAESEYEHDNYLKMVYEMDKIQFNDFFTQLEVIALEADTFFVELKD